MTFDPVPMAIGVSAILLPAAAGALNIAWQGLIRQRIALTKSSFVESVNAKWLGGIALFTGVTLISLVGAFVIGILRQSIYF